MKILIISDIHSNLEALISVINATRKESFDLKICLGDIIGYGPDPDQCIKILEKENFISIKGNHERMLIDKNLRIFANKIAREAIEWTDENISTKSRIFIENLKNDYFYNEILFVHGSPKEPDEYILRKSIAINNIEYLKEKEIHLCFFGHTHIPIIFFENGEFLYKIDEKIHLDIEKFYLINPGSVGQPRDKNPAASYCIFDDKDFSFIFKRTEYNISRTVEKIEENRLPPECGTRLFYGI